MGVIGFGRIGQETAKIALGIGMNVLYHDKFVDSVKINLEFTQNQKVSFEFNTSTLDDLLGILTLYLFTFQLKKIM